ncbi:MAG: M48 family metalloprotease [Deltaproteobacteria bacterium]|nr:M48 family metalloprotease [Deltaproteobacteria bacterium]
MTRLRLTIFLIILAIVFVCEGNSFAGSNAANHALASSKERANVVAKQLSKIVGFDIKVIIIDDKTPEAYVYPDGTVVLTKGILDIVKTNDELAFLIGHEIAHTIHGNNQETIFQIIGGHNLPEQVRHEIQADISGMLYAEKAGFNPFASVKLLAKMVKKDSLHSFDERFEAMSRFLSNKWDPYYWAE